MKTLALMSTLGLTLACDPQPPTDDDEPAAPAGPSSPSSSSSSTPLDSTASEDDATTGGEADGPGDGATTEGTSGESCEISHAIDIQPIWDAHCTAACHEAGGSWTNVLLTADAAYDDLVGEDGTQTAPFENYELVMPGDVAGSYLVHKLRDTSAAAVGKSLAGVGMPAVEIADGEFAFETALSEADITRIEAWIDCGAPP